MNREHSVKSKLNALGVIPRKSRGQSFLSDPQIVYSIAEFADIQKDEWVLEIGPGLGVLTEEVLKATNDVTLVELDRKLHAELCENFASIGENDIICNDITRVDLFALSKKRGKKCVVVGNVPYSISSDIVLWILKHRAVISRASLLLQKEFACRLAAEPGNKSYGSITVQVMLYTKAILGRVVSGVSFHPPAKVDSQLIKLRILDKPSVDLADTAIFEKLVRTCFCTRRKTILNCLSRLGYFESKEHVKQLLDSLNIDSKRRPETLSPADFAKISDKVPLVNTTDSSSKSQYDTKSQ